MTRRFLLVVLAIGIFALTLLVVAAFEACRVSAPLAWRLVNAANAKGGVAAAIAFSGLDLGSREVDFTLEVFDPPHFDVMSFDVGPPHGSPVFGRHNNLNVADAHAFSAAGKLSVVGNPFFFPMDRYSTAFSINAVLGDGRRVDLTDLKDAKGNGFVGISIRGAPAGFDLDAGGSMFESSNVYEVEFSRPLLPAVVGGLFLIGMLLFGALFIRHADDTGEVAASVPATILAVWGIREVVFDLAPIASLTIADVLASGVIVVLSLCAFVKLAQLRAAASRPI